MKQRLNTALNFDDRTEKDIIELVQSCSENKKLNRLLETALRICCSTQEGQAQLKAGMKGMAIDIDRRKFFEQVSQKQANDAYERNMAINELTGEMVECQLKMDTAMQKIESELAKLYVLADSGKLLGLEKRVNLLNVERLLLQSESRRMQAELWSKIGRPQKQTEQVSFEEQLPKQAEQLMEYMSVYYCEHLTELKGLFVENTTTPDNGQLLQMLTQLIGNMQAVPVTKGTSEPEPQKITQIQEQKESLSVKQTVPETEDVKPDVDAAMDMFGAIFDF